MDTNKLNAIAESAQMIVGGYAFTQAKDGHIRVVYLHAPYHALVMTKNGETLETNMDDIEISIVNKIWDRNKKLLEEVYA